MPATARRSLFRDHDVINVLPVNGLFDRGYGEVCPIDHFPSSDITPSNTPNLIFEDGVVASRQPFNTLASYPGTFTYPVLRFRNYIRTGGLVKRITLDSNAHFWADNTDLGAVTGAKDFASVVIGNRIYISPFDANGIPLSGVNVKVYDGTTFRDAGGTAPTMGTFAAATSATAGVIEAGLHLISVAYETDSGFITPPGTPIQYTAPGAKKIDLTNIPTGGSSVVARHILITRYIPRFDGNLKNYYLYFIAKINDNSTTSLTIDQYDSALTSSASYLWDELATIPAGTHLGVYKNSLVSAGAFGSLEKSTVRVSKPGDFESFSSVDGFRTIFPEDGSGYLKNTFEYRGTLYMTKSFRTYSMYDNGGPVNTWPVTLVDAGIGCEPHGVARMNGLRGVGIDGVIIASHAGIMLFQGTYVENLTWKVQGFYDNVDKTSSVDALVKSEICVDEDSRRIFFNMVYNAGIPRINYVYVPQIILVGDYSRGLNRKNIKWCPWNAKNGNGSLRPVSMSFGIVDAVSYTPVLQVAFSDPVTAADARIGLFGYDTSGVQSPADGHDNLPSGVYFPSYVTTALVPDSERGVYHYGGVRIRDGSGLGTYKLSYKTNSQLPFADSNDWYTYTADGRERRALSNYKSRRARLLVTMTSGRLHLYELETLVKELYSDIPTGAYVP